MSEGMLGQLELSGLSTSSVSDALGTGSKGGILTGIDSMTTHGAVAGLAFTVGFEEGDGPFNDYLERVPPGSVLVLDGGGRVEHSLWGGLAATYACRRRLSGTVINGACRDVAEISGLDYPVFARAATPRSGRGVLYCNRVAAPLLIAGVSVNPGDIIIADRDGVVVVPSDEAAHVVDRARAIEHRDDATRERVLAGMSLANARGSLTA